MNNSYIKLNYTDIVLTICIYFGSLIVLSMLSLIPIKVFSITENSLSEEILINISLVFGYILTFILLYYLLFKPRGQKQKLSFSAKGIFLFPVILFLYIGQLLFSEFFITLIPTTGNFWGDLYDSMLHALVGNINKHPYVVFFTVCIIAPVFEEIFFRGYILKGLLNNNISPYVAIIASALIFGGIHIYPWQVVGGIFAGLILGLVFYKTQSLLLCITLHFLNNLFSLILFFKYEDFDTPTFNNPYITLAVGILLITIFGFIYLKLTKNTTWKYY